MANVPNAMTKCCEEKKNRRNKNAGYWLFWDWFFLGEYILPPVLAGAEELAISPWGLIKHPLLGWPKFYKWGGLRSGGGYKRKRGLISAFQSKRDPLQSMHFTFCVHHPLQYSHPLQFCIHTFTQPYSQNHPKCPNDTNCNQKATKKSPKANFSYWPKLIQNGSKWQKSAIRGLWKMMAHKSWTIGG